MKLQPSIVIRKEMQHTGILKKNIYPTFLLLIAVIFSFSGCGTQTPSKDNPNVVIDTGSVNQYIPPVDQTAKDLNEGKAVPGNKKSNCDNSFVSDALNFLCDLFGSGACLSQTSSCNSYARQIYTGSVLGKKAVTQWNGRGGSGDLMANAAICTLRELSPKVPGGGPLKSDVSIDIGLGDVKVSQEIGYLEFDRINARFKGYRKVKFTLPVLGTFDAITQNIDLNRVYYGTSFNSDPYAGAYLINYGYGLNLFTEEKDTQLEIKPPSFTIATPIGPFDVQPVFIYGSNTVVADKPFYKDYTFLTLPEQDNEIPEIKYSDLYGIIDGVNATTPSVNISNYKEQRTGWVSQLGLGTRGLISQKAWSPPKTGTFSRPDYGSLDFTDYLARSDEENLPTISVKAEGKIKYPKEPSELLPKWVFDLPGVSTTAYIQVTPTIQADASGQFGIVQAEGTNHSLAGGEFKISSDRLANLGIYSGVKAGASFYVDVLLRIKVTASYWFGSIDLIDIDPHFPVPLKDGTKSSNVELATAFSSNITYPDFPETLDSLTTFKGTKPNPAAFIEQCFAKENEVPPELPPEPEAEKGKPEDLFKIPWPCNICIYTKEAKDPITNAVLDKSQSEILHPATTAPGWKCDSPAKSGCMDMCILKSNGELVVASGPDEIAKDIPVDNPAHSHFLTCKYSCDDNPPPSLLNTCPGDTTPPAISSYYPADKVTGIKVNSTITVTFYEQMDASTINTNTFLIDNGVTGRVAYDSVTNTATFTADPPLSGNTNYNVTITTDVKDVAGNPFTGLLWSFTTEPLAVPGNRTAFLTSVQGNGNLSTWADAAGKTGIAAGDAICQARAGAAGLPKSANFKAWLSDSTTHAIDRITSDGPWVRTDGVTIADNKADLTDGTISTDVSRTETGEYLSTGAWTGTGSDGQSFSRTSTCSEWTSADISNEGTAGDSNSSDGLWSSRGQLLCSSNLALYCFED